MTLLATSTTSCLGNVLSWGPLEISGHDRIFTVPDRVQQCVCGNDVGARSRFVQQRWASNHVRFGARFRPAPQPATWRVGFQTRGMLSPRNCLLCRSARQIRFRT